MADYLPPGTRTNTRVMMFVDGENLAIRYGATLGNRPSFPHVVYEKNVYVWSKHCNIGPNVADVIRRHYYTSVGQDEVKRQQVAQELRKAGIEQPRIFPRRKERGSKRVDISLTTDMLTHAHRNNYDLAVLVAGDEDYLPLVEAIQAEGKRLVLWFLEDGLSATLKNSADYYYDLGKIVFESDKQNLMYLHV